MKCLVIYDMYSGRAHNPSPEAVPALTQMSRDWEDALRTEGKIETSYLFAIGGGAMVVNVDSPNDLMSLLQSNPSAPFLRPEVHLLVDTFGEGLGRLGRGYERTLDLNARLERSIAERQARVAERSTERGDIDPAAQPYLEDLNWDVERWRQEGSPQGPQQGGGG